MGVTAFGRLILLALVMVGALLPQSPAAAGDNDFGPFGPQGPRMREQLWLLPSATPGLAMRATVFRPQDGAPIPGGLMPAGGGTQQRPLVVINHGTSEATRHSVSLPIYFWLSRWFVDRGYVVVLPQRRGHGATGGELAEGRDSCSRPDHFGAGQRGADDIVAAIDFMTGQSFVAQGATVVVGISTGGWASLALSSRNLPQVKAVVNFAGGRGGHAWGKPSQICDAEQLVQAAGRYGSMARIPSIWLYSSNDSYFGPNLAKAMSQAYANAGGKSELHVVAPYKDDGHTLADDQAGWALWGRQLAEFLARVDRETPTATNQAPARPGYSSVPVSLR